MSDVAALKHRQEAERELLEALFGDKPKTYHLESFLEGNKVAPLSPDLFYSPGDYRAVNLGKSFLTFFSSEKVPNFVFTDETKRQLNEKARVGKAFRERKFNEYYTHFSKEDPDLSPLFRTLRSIVYPTTQKSFKVQDTPITRQRAEQLANNDFQTKFRRAPDPTNYSETREMQRTINRYETFHEERKPSPHPDLEYLNKVEAIRALEALLKKIDKHVDYSGSSKFKKVFVRTLKANVTSLLTNLEASNSLDVTTLLEDAQKRLEKEHFIHEYNKADKNSSPRYSNFEKETNDTLRDIKWWGYSQGFDHWKKRDLKAKKLIEGLFGKKLAGSRHIAEKYQIKESWKRAVAFTQAAVKVIILSSLLFNGVSELAINMKNNSSDSNGSNSKKPHSESTQNKKRGKRSLDTNDDNKKQISGKGGNYSNPDLSDPSFNPKMGEEQNGQKQLAPLYDVRPDPDLVQHYTGYPFITATDESKGNHFILEPIEKVSNIAPATVTVNSVDDLYYGEKFSIPTPFGHKLTSLRVDLDADDYDLYRTETGLYFIKTNEPYSGSLEAGFAADKELFDAEIDEIALDGSELRKTSKVIREAGFTNLADSLVALIESNEKIFATDIAQLISNETIYSHTPGREGEYKIPMKANPRVRFFGNEPEQVRDFSKFNVYASKFYNNLMGCNFVGECDHANELLKTILEDDRHFRYFYDANRTGELLTGSDFKLRPPGHSELILRSRNGVVGMLDATATKKGEQSTHVEMQNFDRKMEELLMKYIMLSQPKLRAALFDKVHLIADRWRRPTYRFWDGQQWTEQVDNPRNLDAELFHSHLSLERLYKIQVNLMLDNNIEKVQEQNRKLMQHLESLRIPTHDKSFPVLKIASKLYELETFLKNIDRKKLILDPDYAKQTHAKMEQIKKSLSDESEKIHLARDRMKVDSAFKNKFGPYLSRTLDAMLYEAYNPLLENTLGFLETNKKRVQINLNRSCDRLFYKLAHE